MKAAAAFTALATAALLTAWAWRATPAPDRPRPDEDAYAGTSSVSRACASASPGGGSAPCPARHPPDANGGRAGAMPQLSLTDNQELIADFALRDLMDRFLLNSGQSGRMQALADHLRRTLPAAAAASAIRIAASYQTYLAAHDELLAAQRFTSNDAASQDLNRISSWQQQRQQLRNRMLGERITLEWFGNEDAYLGQALDEWRQRSEGHPPAADAEPEDQAAHDQHMRQTLNQAIASYQRAASAN